MFTEKEISYIRSQRLARIATVSKNLQPDVAPVSFEFDGKHFFIRGFDIARTFKFKNVKAGNSRVALVIDDLASLSPWMARGIKIHGIAEVEEAEGKARLRINPQRSWSWGVEAMAFENGKPVSRKSTH